MRYLVFTSMAAAGLTIVGCGSLASFGGKKSDKSNASSAPVAPAQADQSKTGAAKGAGGTTASGSSLGLADFCKFSVNDKGQGCFDCTPRELDIVQCVATPSGFDPKAMCKHDIDSMTCDIGAKDPFVIDFQQQSNAEKVYDKVPLLVFAAKALLASKLENDPPAIKNLVYGALDAIQADKKALFAGGDVQPFLDTMGGLVKAAAPGVSDAEVTSTETALKSAIDTVRTAKNSGNFQDADFVKFAESAMSALPASIVGKVIPTFDVGSLTSNLKNSTGNSDVLAGLLAGLGGGMDVNQVLATLGAGGSGASTGTGTSTAQ